MANRKSRDQIVYRASTTAPVNIAIIKYWGKRDSKLNLPTNSSLSVTLAQRDLRTHTTASCSASYAHDTLTLNAAPQDITTPRSQACLRELRALRAQLEAADPALAPLSTYPLRIVSINNFPTAAGLASSAAGFAALVRAIADLYALPTSATELSRIARQGSGSACRSLHGGFVAWEAGARSDGADSIAAPLFPAAHWPGLRALILVISAAKKDVPSTAGMQATVATSALFATRAADIVPQRMAQMRAAVAERDFSAFGLLCMRDSNTFHATCLDTWPPITYLTDSSRAAMRMVEEINRAAGEIICAYTFDAGPNCVVFYDEAEAHRVEDAFRAVVGHVEGWGGEPGQAVSSTGPLGLSVDERIAGPLRDGVCRVIMTGIGEPPISTQEHLIDENGNVK